MTETPLEIELCAPGCALVAQGATKAILPGAAGIFTVLPGHTTLLSHLIPGAVITIGPHGSDFYAVHGGFAQVLNNRILVLTETMEHSASIDAARAEAAKERAEIRIDKPQEGTNLDRARAALARATARLQAHRREAY